ncbi:Transcription factor FAMA [Raphanus sativus]|uniref:Transcription factor FAMA n=1 Tax=Raphanus sativus TaxID=3726 RepID=A0A6J0JG67_RAPSA|nr:transcription factor FAMA [Raphanus sativus]XP_018434616.1 transcription factor FAMA [Raphanus sativus]XP_018434618.1 transcription factor FAMA [Raphanus sativus]KAJ4887253.1 Transcription factor FAMA [Raphanus sativus]
MAMDKEYSAPNFLGESSGGKDDTSDGMIDYMFNRNLQQEKQSMPQQHQLSPSGFGATPTFDKMSFADVMQFADFGPKLALNQTRNQDDQDTGQGMDPVYFLKFPVLNDKIEDHNQTHHLMSQEAGECEGNIGNLFLEEKENQEDENDNNSVQLRFIGGEEEEDDRENKNVTTKEVKSKRKRARTSKTSEEVESQRMTHIAVERNRRKQMNEHLRVLRSLMPGSYVQRGDQASIIGGAIEFVRELEQLLQCLESQKRRRILGETGNRHLGDMTTTTTTSSPITSVNNPLIITGNVTESEGGGGLQEETAENKSCLADVEVKLLGFDAMIKILSRRRPGQLIKTIAALEDLHLSILHTNITTMEQTVLYSFNVKITSETRFTAEDIASSIQEIFTFIHANTTM